MLQHVSDKTIFVDQFLIFSFTQFKQSAVYNELLASPINYQLICLGDQLTVIVVLLHE